MPYTVWGNTSKVVLRVPADLRFHPVIHDAPPTHVASTSWLNYNFPSTTASTMFQNALMGKTLLLSVKTKRTMRIHNGLVAGTFAYQEQLCGLENLRVWQDNESDAVVALVHYTAHFRDGYLAFYLNSARDPIRIKEEGEKCVRVKGINVPVDEGRRLSQRASGGPNGRRDVAGAGAGEKRIAGCKIEFWGEEDRRAFLECVREAQGTFWAGVK